VAEEAPRLQALAEACEATQPSLSEELRALTLVSLGITEVWAVRFEEAQRHLEDGVALARRIERPYLEYSGLAYQAVIELVRSSYAPAVERSEHAIELAERHGWTDEPAAGHAYVVLAGMLGWQGRAEEADHMLQRAERSVKAEAEPAAALLIAHIRGVVELARGRLADALTAFQTEDRLAGRLAAPHLLAPSARAMILYLLVQLGETERAEQVLAALDDRQREPGEMRIAIAALRLAQDDPPAALVTLEPVLDGAAPRVRRTWLTEAFLVEAMAKDAAGDPAAAGRALERALDLAEPVGGILTLLKAPRGLLERQARGRTVHAALIARILDHMAGGAPAPPSAGPRPPSEPVSDSELRVLRYLPTHLSAPEIAAQLSVSTSTVKTHLRNLYGKLGVHSRAEAVERARGLGMLAPSGRSPA
jgi:LuxR family transcriptional regulator, maltose regulon positive regulatory protein